MDALLFASFLPLPTQVNVGPPGKGRFDNVSVLKISISGCTCWEILLKMGTTIVYLEDLGYEECCRFETRDEVDIEIARLTQVLVDEAAAAAAASGGTESAPVSATSGGTV